MTQPEKAALKASYLNTIVDAIGGEIVPDGVAIKDATGEWVVINPVVKQSFDIEAARDKMAERAKRAADKAEKATKAKSAE